MVRRRKTRYKGGGKNYRVKDTFFQKAKKAGYRARSAYKLKEILRKYPVIQSGNRVLDLGAAPGSFLQVLAERGCKVLGVDLKEIKPLAGVETVVADIFDFECDEKFDVVTSDLMPNTTGIKFVDNEESVDLNLRALEVTKDCLKEGGNAVFKIFNSNELRRFNAEAQKCFEELHVVKPEAVRSTSKEIYVVCLGFKW